VCWSTYKEKTPDEKLQVRDKQKESYFADKISSKDLKNEFFKGRVELQARTAG
jgi:hypothetical protein